MEALRLHFKPEFLNRVDDILIFQRLSKEQLREIVTLQMVRLQRLLAERHLNLELTRQGPGLPGRRRLRPGVRGQAPAPGHPDLPAG